MHSQSFALKVYHALQHTVGKHCEPSRGLFWILTKAMFHRNHKPTKLCPKSHAPKTWRGEHECFVDIWGLGHFIKTSKFFGLSQKLIKLQDCCLLCNPHLRPSAQCCIKELSSMILEGHREKSMDTSIGATFPFWQEVKWTWSWVVDKLQLCEAKQILAFWVKVSCLICVETNMFIYKYEIVVGISVEVKIVQASVVEATTNDPDKA